MLSDRMNKKIIFISIMLILITVVNACVFSDKVEFYHPMDLDVLKLVIKSEKQKHEILNNTVLIYYNDFILSVNENSAIVTCKEVRTECMDDLDFRDILDDLEDWNAYDLSKEEKNNIAELYQSNIVIKRLSKENLLIVKIKSGVLKLLGRLFCVNYEKVLECKEDWCGIQVLKSEKCLYFREKC